MKICGALFVLSITILCAQDSVDCEVGVVNGLRLGMSIDSVRSVNLDWWHKSKATLLAEYKLSEDQFIDRFGLRGLRRMLSSHSSRLFGYEVSGSIQYKNDAIDSIGYSISKCNPEMMSCLEIYSELLAKCTLEYGEPHTEELITDELQKNAFWICSDKSVQIMITLLVVDGMQGVGITYSLRSWL